MERIKVLLSHIIELAKIKKMEDVEISARVLLGSIERDCISEFSDVCVKFSEDKVIERMMDEN